MIEKQLDLKELLLQDDTSTFSETLDYIKLGIKMSRKSWDNWLYVFLCTPTKDIKNIHNKEVIEFSSFLAVKDCCGRVLPWLPNQEDLFAEDWYDVKEY